MKTHLRICLLLALSAYMAVPVYTLENRRQTAASTQAGEVAAVRSAFEKLVHAFNAKDAQAVMTFFAEDIILSYAKLPDANYQTNKERFQKAFVPRLGITETFSAEIEEIQVSGDMAFVRATWTYKAERKNPDKQFISKERDIEIWRRQANGEWKMVRGLSYPIEPLPTATPKPDSK